MAKRQRQSGREQQPPIVSSVILRRDWVPSFDAYPFSIPAIRNLHQIDLHRAVTFFVGENGSGKSTLLEAIAVHVGFNPEGGTKNFNFSTRSSHSALWKCLELARSEHRSADGFFLRAESLFNVATEVERLGLASSYGGKSLHEQSHGESFLAIVSNRFKPNGLYLLDEPEAALSPNRQMSMLSLLHQLVRQGSQFIIATHSPILLAYPHSIIYHFSADGIVAIPYTQTEQYRITRMFLDHTDQMLDELLRDEE